MNECINEPIISVIVPVYRVEKFLPRCIASILAQTFRDFELILVDDGSDDACPAICDQAAQNDVRVSVIHQKNQGLSAARNAGIDAARGQYIAFVDSDDFIADTMLEDMYERICTDGSELAICNFQYVDEAGAIVADRVGQSPITDDEVIDNRKAVEKLCIEKSWYYIFVSNKLYAHKLFDNIRFPIGKRNEDVFVAHEFLWAAKRVSILKKPLYYYVQRTGSIMHSKPTAKNLDAVEGWFACCRFALDHNLDNLAVRGYNGAISEIADNVDILDLNDNEVKAAMANCMRCARELRKSIMHISGHKGDKIKALLFAISPRLYRTIKLRVRKNTVNNTSKAR